MHQNFDPNAKQKKTKILAKRERIREYMFLPKLIYLDLKARLADFMFENVLRETDDKSLSFGFIEC